ncbi:hypothetical protein [Xanthomonas arboricola]|uniref:hypothetical protein n=1 Tax=Xanthomonas arboricola TaxID=56448 RepID=UPI0012FD0C42|nr:hypothetical protein [Xanthomonas arboricola]MDN0218210.1 hypothetical protein [Xanthomonas arboricola pv. corylina]MDN0221001.1 hypothetical protein [Xanthomonas arboricola pv. juglandis]MDN0246834.1 hypothetical protein [Xanthomonas arboricola pv. juglandis]
MIKISRLQGLPWVFSKEAAASTRKTKGMPGVGWIARLFAIAIARAAQSRRAALDK